jgi:hypothetical protein
MNVVEGKEGKKKEKKKKRDATQHTAELTYTFTQNRSRYVSVNYFSERRALSFISLEACRRAHEGVSCTCLILSTVSLAGDGCAEQLQKNWKQ